MSAARGDPEERYRDLFENAMTLSTVRSGGKLTSFNHAGEQILTAHPKPGMNIAKIVANSPFDKAKTEEKFAGSADTV
jgi:hypothetical protein